MLLSACQVELLLSSREHGAYNELAPHAVGIKYCKGLYLIRPKKCDFSRIFLEEAFAFIFINIFTFNEADLHVYTHICFLY